jgi:hypothetical protein
MMEFFQAYLLKRINPVVDGLADAHWLLDSAPAAFWDLDNSSMETCFW